MDAQDEAQAMDSLHSLYFVEHNTIGPEIWGCLIQGKTWGVVMARTDDYGGWI